MARPTVFIIITSSLFVGAFAASFRKCCPKGQEYLTADSGCAYPKNQNRSLQIPIYNNINLVETKNENSFSIINSPWCKNGIKYRLEPPADVYYLQTNGSLYTPEDPVKQFDSAEFCNEYFDDLKSYSVIICANATKEEVILSRSKSIGMLISMPFLLITFLIYAGIPELRNLHGKSLMCYVATLLMAYIFLVSVQLGRDTISPNYCLIAPFFIYFAFMVSFLWLNVMCIDIWWTFTGRRGFKGSVRQSERYRFLVYCAYAWGVPLLMLGITALLQFTPNLPAYVIRPHFADYRCWFPDDKTVGYYFYGPIMVVILLNMGLFSWTSYRIWQVQRDTDQSMRHESQRHGSDSDKQRYKLYLKLMMVFGVNWLMEIISWLASGPQWLWYVTDMCNALYGVFIFLIFVCKANVWKLFKKRSTEVYMTDEFYTESSKYITNYHMLMGRPYLAQTYAPTSSTRSTAITTDKGQDSFALNTSPTA